MLIVVDEAEGVLEPIYEAIDAVMTAGNSKLLLIGNPTSITGTFRRAFHEERHLYHNITISALDSPNVKQQRVVLPGLTTHEWVAERAALWGEASPMYHARVLGDFSDRAEDTLISLTHIEQAIARGLQDATSPSQGLSQNSPLPQRERARVRGNPDQEPQESDSPNPFALSATEWSRRANIQAPDAPTILAVDVARFGADQSVLLLASPTAVLRLEAHHGLDTMQLAGRVVDAHRHWSPARPPDRIVVDEIGVGAGVVDRLKELKLPVTGINVGRPARQRTLFANLRAEGYWRLRELFSQSQVAIPNDPELAGQLSSLRYSYNSRGQLIIESKDDARARGIPSPDKADAMMLAFLGHNPAVRLRT